MYTSDQLLPAGGSLPAAWLSCHPIGERAISAGFSVGAELLDALEVRGLPAGGRETPNVQKK